MSTLALMLIVGLVILLLITGVDSIPTLLFVLNPDSMRIAFEDPAAEQDRLSRSAELGEWIGRLKDMGFSLVGVKSERLPLWGRTYREAALVSRAVEAYAGIVLHPDGTPASMYFFTPLENGGMVFTRNHQYGREAGSGTLSVANVPSKDFREIMESHERRLRIFLDRGMRPLVGSGQQARIEATGIFYRSEYARQVGRSLASPSVMGFLLSLVSLAAILIWNTFLLR